MNGQTDSVITTLAKKPGKATSGGTKRKSKLPQFENTHTADEDAAALIDKVKNYNASADTDLLQRAIEFCENRHQHQRRASGEPYATHPLAVAHILADRKLDMDSVITGLLHDVVEDTDTSADDIAAEFSTGIAELVDGVTKLTDLEKQSLAAARESGDQFRALTQSANYRKMFIAVSRDVRVLLVKLADRLHNMRTLDYIEKAEKRQRIARETLLVYAPLAERIGIYLWKTELQDLSFRQLNGRAYREIEAHLQKIKGNEKQLEAIQNALTELLAEHNIKAKTASRLKNPASIWQKMERRGIALSELADIMAFRIIVEDEETCYRALGAIHARYKSFSNGFRDYISAPKPNGYKSLHTAVAGPNDNLIEIQIRTPDMHEHSENGIAAHWRYKNDETPKHKQDKQKGLAWLRDMMERLERLEEDPQTAMKAVELDLYQDQVFCFTPRHDVISLTQGSVLLDFAYAVHTELGHTCTGGTINGRKRPINHVLQNGDRVEIFTSKTQTPHETWKDIVQTHNAKAAIRDYFKYRTRKQATNLGKTRLQKFFKSKRADFSDEVMTRAVEVLQKRKIFNRKIDKVSDLYYAVGCLQIEPEDILAIAHPGLDKKLRNRSGVGKLVDGFLNKKALIANHPDTEFALYFAPCCHPLPGDKVVGIKTIGVGLSLHRSDCAALHNVIGMKERWIDAEWDTQFYGNRTYIGRLQVTLKNHPGALAQVCDIIGNQEVNIGNLKFLTRSGDYYVVAFDLDVYQTKQLQSTIRALKKCADVHDVIRK